MALERALGREFQDRSLLVEALTHASAAGRLENDNQRLEFLGDRVLGLLTAEALLQHYPQDKEGALAPRLNALVRREACAEAAEAIGLGAHLRMARSEAATGGRRKSALLADAMEAVMAAVYLDGGLEAARAVFAKLWGDRIGGLATAPIDAKTALQEWSQARGGERPEYVLLRRDGPDHAPSFEIEARLTSGEAAQGTAASKRAAEQAAAAALLALVDPASAAKENE
ncbi:MAG: ribonuclease III [Neomegalonema sp.]|nr:ribonuclease III [Neomegalonema sp.]